MCGLGVGHCAPFMPSKYPGYAHRRSIGDEHAGEAFAAESGAARTYALVSARERAEAVASKALPGELAKLQSPYAGAWAGNPKGDVTLVAFMDYACGYCRASLPAIAELLRRDPNVRVVYREYPVLGPDSLVAARWALAAAEQDKFPAFHDALFATDGPSAGNIEAAARKAGLDMDKARQAIGSKAVEGEIIANHKFGQKLAMTGTPSWVIGGKLLYGMREYDGLAAAVAEARKK